MKPLRVWELPELDSNDADSDGKNNHSCDVEAGQAGAILTESCASGI